MDRDQTDIILRPCIFLNMFPQSCLVFHFFVTQNATADIVMVNYFFCCLKSRKNVCLFLDSKFTWIHQWRQPWKLNKSKFTLCCLKAYLWSKYPTAPSPLPESPPSTSSTPPCPPPPPPPYGAFSWRRQIWGNGELVFSSSLVQGTWVGSDWWRSWRKRRVLACQPPLHASSLSLSPSPPPSFSLPLSGPSFFPAHTFPTKVQFSLQKNPLRRQKIVVFPAEVWAGMNVLYFFNFHSHFFTQTFTSQKLNPWSKVRIHSFINSGL